jgi:hypothetical protein
MRNIEWLVVVIVLVLCVLVGYDVGVSYGIIPVGFIGGLGVDLSQVGL